MNIIKNLLNPLLNCEEALFELCHQLKVDITSSSIEKSLEEHPDYPSLLSVSDVLKIYGIDNISLKTPVENLKKLPTPFIAQIKSPVLKQDLFSVVIEVDAFFIKWFNPETHKLGSMPYEQFSKLYTGIVLIAESSDNSGEKDYFLNRKKEQTNYFLKFSALISIPAVTLIMCFLSFLNVGITSIGIISYTLLTLAGCITASLLIYYEIDQYNPALQQICHAGKKQIVVQF